MPRRTRANCRGSGRSLDIDADPICPVCYGDVRVRVNRTIFVHRSKAPTTRSDPNHSKRILETYGITGEEYESILKAQGGVCFICQKPPRSKRLAVDHDHDKGNTREAVRGLLCRRCNHRLLGSAHDAVPMLQRAIDYLTKPPAHLVLETT
jgi:hypothetical protein